MLVRQDPISKLWCREDGKVLMPPCPKSRANRHTYEWVSGWPADRLGHLVVGYHRKNHYVHRIIARAFIPNPDGLPTVDHIDRDPKNNRADNLRWASYKTQAENRQICDDCKAKYGVRGCEDGKAYHRVHDKAYRAAQKAKGLVLRKCPDGKRHWIQKE